MIKALVVEDSAVIREFLVHILGSDPEIDVIATANNGEAALDFLERNKADVITMDIHMPKMDGFEATRRIMETFPTPIIIVSGSSSVNEVANTFHAIEAGALAFVPRPVGIGHPDHEKMAKELIQTVKLMSEVKVVRRWARTRKDKLPLAVAPPPEIELEHKPVDIKLVVIGASTGGPLVLQTVLSGLPKDLPAPVLVVQHIAQGFAQGLVEWLARSTGFPAHLAAFGEVPLPGHAYVAPDGFHMGVTTSNGIILSEGEPENGLRPSVSFL
ncbi:MAG: response regulator, partial [Candidatus Lindowbacteria bacterium]|nr:response regulator [Candidatus Lindowbacteria bacterium]